MEENLYIKEFCQKGKSPGIRAEWDVIRHRRKKLGLAEESPESEAFETKAIEQDLCKDDPPFDIFAIALSGGGIRSATFNLGFLQALNQKGILKHADYLSTVSGGGYIGSYLQNRLRQTHDYETLFDDEEIKRLRNYGDYLRPGKGLRKVFESFNFYINVIIQALLHSIWFLLFFLLLFVGLVDLAALMPEFPALVTTILVGCFSFLLFYYYFLHGLRHLPGKLWSAKKLYYGIAAVTLLLLLSAYLSMDPKMFPQELQIFFTGAKSFLFLLMLTVALGFFANPNILSAHRLYRFRLKDAFLYGSDRKLYELLEEDKDEGGESKLWIRAPYPLINTTLNLQNEKERAQRKGEGEKKYFGAKSCDYYLLSPLYCGSKRTGYLATDRSEYGRMTLATAMTISGAAVNPSMGYKSNRVLSFFMTLLNIRLGYWALNPKIFDPENGEEGRGAHRKMSKFFRSFAQVTAKKFQYAVTLWPYYNLAELFGNMNSDRIRINLSDGGNIENLAVFELLRRRCRLIIVSDAGADADYRFSDLQNLMIRARNELGLSIEFSEDQNPGHRIAPNLKTGQSASHFAVAEIYDLKSEPPRSKMGYLVYVKASVVPQKGIEESSKAFYDYQLYHPDFPHESTVDQFFDSDQWEAYRSLGEEIGGKLFDDFEGEISVGSLTRYFERYL